MFRVLIVGANAVDVSLLDALHQTYGWEMKVAHHAADALNLALSDPPDLVVCGEREPIAACRSLLHDWRADARLSRIPFVVSGATDAEMKEERIGLALEVSGYIAKSAQPEQFVARILEIMAGRAVAAEPETREPSRDVELLLKESNAVLVRKLEEKALQLERTNRELAVREARLRAILDTEPECVKIMDADFTLLEMNPAGLRMIEADSFEEVAVGSSLHLVVEEDREAFRALNKRVFAGESGVLEYRIVGLKGGRRWLETHATPLRGENGKVVSLLGVTRDITQRKQAEEALHESAEWLRLAIQASGVGLWEWDLGTNLFNYSREWKSQLGYEEHEIGNEFSEWEGRIHPDDLVRTLECVNRSLAQPGTVCEPEFRMRHRDGSWRWFFTRGEVSRDDTGAAVRMMGCHVDITERKQAEDALRGTAFQLQTALNMARMGVWSMDFRSGEMRTIQGGGPISGLQGASYPNTESAFFELVHPDDRAMVEHLVENAKAGGEYEAEFRVVLPDGDVRYVAAKGHCLRDEAGTPITFAGVDQDITKRKKDEEALRQSEAQFRAICEAAPIGIFLNGPNGDITYSNPAGLRITGLSSEEMLGTYWISAVFPDDRARVLEEWKACRAADVPFNGTGRFLHADGRIVWWDGVTAPIHDGVTRLGSVGILVDITERKRVESELREAQERLQFAVGAGKVGLWDWDLRNRKMKYSREWKRQIGYDEDEIDDNVDEWRSRLHPDDRDRVIEEVQTYLRGDDPDFEAEFRFRHKNGSYRYILARATDVRGTDGKRIWIVGSHVDITEYAQLQAQFLQSRKMESLGRLAGGVAHDFNNLLTVISGYANLSLAKLKEGEPFHHDFQEITRASERAAALTRQLLAVSRRQIQKLEVLNLNTVVADMESMLRRLIGEDIEMVFVPAHDLANVRADAGQIEQVVMNLALNARDAMPTGGRLTIETGNVELDANHGAERPTVEPGPYVMLAISDTGIGMDEATRARVFEPFFTTKDVGMGTGLGLATVYGIVEQSGGTIQTHSEVGKGTTFRIYLRRVKAEVGHPRPAQAVTPVRGGETLLVVEDEESLRQFISRLLREAGYKVLSASNGDEALLALERHDGEVHLMLTDVVMPGMSGRELAARLKQRGTSMKVLYSSGYTDDAILRHGVLEDEINFIGKPYTAPALTRKVREVLDSESDSPTRA